MNIESRILNTISLVSGIKLSELNSECLFDDLNIDDLDMLEIVMRMEDDFYVYINSEYESWKTIKDAVKFIEDRT